MTKKGKFWQNPKRSHGCRMFRKNPKIVENSISVQMSEKNAKYSKNPGEKLKKKYQKNSKQNGRKSQKHF
jgi:hypothetical protein